MPISADTKWKLVPATPAAAAVMDYFAARYCRSCSTSAAIMGLYNIEITRLYLVAEEINTHTNERREVWKCLICKGTE